MSLEYLVDSPLYAGRSLRQIDLTPAGSKPVRLNVFAEDEADLAATEEQVGIHRALVRETAAALGPPRYAHYDFLVVLSDQHRRHRAGAPSSSENSLAPGISAVLGRGRG